MGSLLSRECERLREWLPEYAEGMLKGRRRARLERHLADCKRCAQEVTDLVVVMQAVRRAPADALPDRVTASIRRAVAERAAPRPSSALRWRTAAAGAAALVLVGTALAVTGRMFSQHRGMGAAPMMAKAAEERLAGRAEAPATPAIPVRQKEPVQIAEARPAPEAPEHTPAAGISAPAAPAAFRRGDADHGLAYRSVPPQPRSGRAFGPPPDLGSGLASRRRGPDHRREWAMGGRAGGVGGGAAGGGIAPSPAASKEATRGDRLAVAETSPVSEAIAEPAELSRSRAASSAGDLGLSSAAAKAAAPAPQLSVRVALATEKEPPSIILDLSADPGVGRVAIYADRPSGKQVLWRGEPLAVRPGEPAHGAAIPLSAQQIGPGPAAVPITVESQVASRSYVLFIPTLATLGQTCGGSPVARYRGEAVAEVLADLSALTGMVLLAEAPLNRPVEGELPAGRPAEVLAQVAGRVGLQVHGEGDLARTLTYPR